MKTKTSFFSLFACLLVLSLLLNACSSNGSDGNNNQPPPKTNDSGNNGNNDKAPNGEQPAEKEREHLELSFFLYGGTDSVLPKGDADFIRTTIEEKFNVTLDVEHISNSEDHSNKLNLKIASGNIPDLFLENAGNQELSSQGVLADLTNYVTPETMPNYFKWITQEEMDQFQFPGVYNRIPIPTDPFIWAYYIRKDWLDNLNLEAPKNFEELTNVMRAFTFDDPDGNGQADTYGWTGWGGGKRLPWTAPTFKANDHVGTHFVDKDGDLRHRYLDPATEGIIADFRTWMDEGIVDPDWFINNSAKAYQRFAQGKVGMVFSFDGKFAFESAPDSYYNKLKAVHPDAEVIPVHPYDNIGNFVDSYMTAPILISSQASEAKIERAIEILDWLSSEEGWLMTHYGLEGKHYTRDGNKIMFKPDAFKKDIVDNGNWNTIYFFSTPGIQDDVLGLEIINPDETDREREITKTILGWHNEQTIGIQPATPDSVDQALLDEMTDKYMIKLLFEDPDTSKWPQYLEDLMKNYGGQQFLESWIEQMKNANVEVNSLDTTGWYE